MRETTGDRFVGHFLSSKDMFHDTNKPWLKYAEALMASAHKHHRQHQHFLSYKLYQLRFVCKKKMIISVNSRRKKHCHWTVCPTKLIWDKVPGNCKEQPLAGEKNVTLPIGRLTSAFYEHFPCNGEELWARAQWYGPPWRRFARVYCSSKEIDRFLFTFNLDAQLSVNLTLHTVLFLPLRHKDRKFCGKAKVTVSGSGNVNEMVFCGQMSNFNVYPIWQKFQVSLNILHCGAHKFNSTFMMVAKGNIFSAEGKVTAQVVVLQAPERLSVSVHKFVIQTVKIYRLILDVFMKNHTVFDGPDLSNKILVPSKGRFAVSTFQCLLLVLERFPEVNQGIKFASRNHSHNITNLVEKTGTVLFLPGPGCGEQMCVASFTTDTALHVNLTVTSFVSEGPEDYTCKYGGFFLLQGTDISHNVSATFCWRRDNDVKLSQSFYSQKASLSFFLFWYQPQATITVSFIVLHTSCSFILSDLCDDDNAENTLKSMFVSLFSPDVDKRKSSECMIFETREKTDCFLKILIYPLLLKVPSLPFESSLIVKGSSFQRFRTPENKDCMYGCKNTLGVAHIHVRDPRPIFSCRFYGNQNRDFYFNGKVTNVHSLKRFELYVQWGFYFHGWVEVKVELRTLKNLSPGDTSPFVPAVMVLSSF